MIPLAKCLKYSQDKYCDICIQRAVILRFIYIYKTIMYILTRM